MSRSISGSGARRAAAFIVLCACAVAARAPSATAQEMVADDPSGGAVVSDGEVGYMSGSCDSGCCDYGDCYGGCDGCMPCDSCDSCDSGCSSCCCSGWFGAEYLRWRLDGGDDLPPLVTAGPLSAGANAAILGQPDTVILSGDEKVNDGWRNGYRFFGGVWLDCCHTCGIGADYFDVGNDDYNFTSPQDGFIVGRPFFNTQTGNPDVELVSVPNELDGTARVRSSDGFRGAGATGNISVWRCCDPCCPGNSSGLSVLGGYRFYDYDSNLSITEQLLVLPGTTTPLVPGTTFNVRDSFRTENEFHGGEVGIQGYKKRCWWWVDGMAKVAMGAQRRTVRINGSTVVSVPNSGVAANAGGLLTSELTNIGTYSDSDFALIPEFRLGLGVCVTKCCSIRGGYNLIYWGDVARAGSQLPPGLQVDPRNLPPVQGGGGAEPIFAGIGDSELIAHGFDASVQFQW